MGLSAGGLICEGAYMKVEKKGKGDDRHIRQNENLYLKK